MTAAPDPKSVQHHFASANQGNLVFCLYIILSQADAALSSRRLEDAGSRTARHDLRAVGVASVREGVGRYRLLLLLLLLFGRSLLFSGSGSWGGHRSRGGGGSSCIRRLVGKILHGRGLAVLLRRRDVL